MPEESKIVGMAYRFLHTRYQLFSCLTGPLLLPGSLFWGFVCLFVCLFLQPHLHMEVPRLGVESKLQLPAYTTATATRDLSCVCDLHPSSWQHQILNPLSERRDRTRIVVDASWVCNLLGHNRNSLFSLLHLAVILADAHFSVYRCYGLTCVPLFPESHV